MQLERTFEMSRPGLQELRDSSITKKTRKQYERAALNFLAYCVIEKPSIFTDDVVSQLNSSDNLSVIQDQLEAILRRGGNQVHLERIDADLFMKFLIEVKTGPDGTNVVQVRILQL